MRVCLFVGELVGGTEEVREVALAEALEEFPEVGDKEGADDGVDGHAEDYGGAEADAGGGAGAEAHRHHAEDEGERRHHNRSESHHTTFIGGLGDGNPLF